MHRTGTIVAASCAIGLGILAYPLDVPGQEEAAVSGQDASSSPAEGDDALPAEGDDALPAEGDDPSSAEDDDPSDDLSRHPVIDGEFELQPYELPSGWRHVTSTINKAENELILFGGLGAGPPSPPTPMNHTVYALDLEKAPSEQEWEERNTDDVVVEPWFTSTRGFVQIEDNHYLTCDDSAQDTVYAFDPVTYSFRVLSVSPLDEQFNAQDCCAVGLKVQGEERVYILGGRDSSADPVIPHVRYYSITHDRWELVADMNAGRSHLGCAAVERAGKSLIYAISGGSDPDQGNTLRSIEIYDVNDDEWTLYDDFLPEGGGRTRLGVQNVDNRYLLLIGGDATCAGGGPGNLCPPDQPLTTVDIIDVRRGKNELLSSEEYTIPQLKLPRQSPANSLRKRTSTHHQEHRYELYVTAGLTEGEDDLEVTPSTEVLSFNQIRVARRSSTGSFPISSLR
jgi:hypothetical protein